LLPFRCFQASLLKFLYVSRRGRRHCTLPPLLGIPLSDPQTLLLFVIVVVVVFGNLLLLLLHITGTATARYRYQSTTNTE